MASDIPNSMASLGLGPGLSSAPSSGLFGTSLTKSFQGINQTVGNLVTNLTKVATLTNTIKNNAAAINRGFGGGGSRGIFNNGNVGSGSSMGLGLGAVNTVAGSGGAGMGGGGGMGMAAGMGGMGPLAAVSLGMSAMRGIGGMAQMALAPAAMAYATLPSGSDVLARNRSMYGLGMTTGMSVNAMSRSLGSFSGMGTGKSDVYGAAGAFAGIGMNPFRGMGNRMMQQAGGMSMMTGQSMTQVAQTMAGSAGSPIMANRLAVIGVQSVDSKGNNRSFQAIADQLWGVLGYSGKPTDLIIRDVLQQGMNGYRTLEYYVPDPATRELVAQYMVSRARNKGKKVNLSNLGGVAGMNGGVLGAEASMRKYYGSETNLLEKSASGMSSGISKTAGAMSTVNDVMSNNPLISQMAALKGSLDTLAGTNAGQGVIAGVTTGLKGMGDVIGAVTSALGTLALAAYMGGGASGLAGLGAGAAGAAGTAAGVLGGLGVGVAGVGATQFLRSHYANNATVGNGTGWQKAGTIAGMAGAGAATGAIIGSVVPVVGTAVGAVAGTVIGGIAGGVQAFSGGAGSGGTGSAAGTGNRGGTTGLIQFATSFVGTRYVWGGTSPTRGWDCSGFTQYVFKRYGVNLPRTSSEQARQGTAIKYSEARAGDLLFFHYPGRPGVNHVGIYMGGGRMVHAANSRKGTIVSGVDTGALVAVRRVLGGSLTKSSKGVSGGNTNTLEPASQSGGYTSIPMSGTTLSTGVSGFSAGLSSIMDALGSGGAMVATGGPSGSGGDATAASASDAPSGGGGDLAAVIRAAGFKGDAFKTAWAVAMAESGGNRMAHNTNAGTGDNSYGLFQINMLGGMGPERRKQFNLSSNAALFNSATNASVAFKMSRGGANWNPWSTYKSGAYRKYLAQAPGYSQGAWNISKDQVANLHAGEMVVPASIATAVRNAMQGGNGGTGGGSGGGYGPVVIQMMVANASDAEIVRAGNKLKSVLNGQASFDSLRST